MEAGVSHAQSKDICKAVFKGVKTLQKGKKLCEY